MKMSNIAILSMFICLQQSHCGFNKKEKQYNNLPKSKAYKSDSVMTSPYDRLCKPDALEGLIKNQEKIKRIACNNVNDMYAHYLPKDCRKSYNEIENKELFLSNYRKYIENFFPIKNEDIESRYADYPLYIESFKFFKKTIEILIEQGYVPTNIKEKKNDKRICITNLLSMACNGRFYYILNQFESKDKDDEEVKKLETSILELYQNSCTNIQKTPKIYNSFSCKIYLDKRPNPFLHDDGTLEFEYPSTEYSNPNSKYEIRRVYLRQNKDGSIELREMHTHKSLKIDPLLHYFLDLNVSSDKV